MVYVVFMTSPDVVDFADSWRLMRKACPHALIQELCNEQRCVFRRGIYSIQAVIWLMLYQRLNSKGTLGSAVQWLVRNPPFCTLRTTPANECARRRSRPTRARIAKLGRNSPKW
jgi:hypothetical protein